MYDNCKNYWHSIKFGSKEKIVALSTNNININFEGVLRKGKNNVYTKLQTELKKIHLG